eukprot:gene10919-biopygen5888
MVRNNGSITARSLQNHCGITARSRWDYGGITVGHKMTVKHGEPELARTSLGRWRVCLLIARRAVRRQALLTMQLCSPTPLLYLSHLPILGNGAGLFGTTNTPRDIGIWATATRQPTDQIQLPGP